MSKYVMIFLVMLLSFFGVYSMNADIQTAASVKNSQYTNYLTSATYDAVKEMKKSTDGTVMMPDSSSREKVINTFFNSLAMDFGYDTTEDMTKLKSYVPVVVMVDNNGYYIGYNHQYLDAEGNTHLKSVITDLNTWSTTSGNYIVRYFLGTKVNVTDLNTMKFYSGTYDEVYDKLSKPTALKELGFDSESSFTKRRNEIIIPKIQDTVEYFINNQNKVASALRSDYTFEMPLTSSDDWARALENPTCIAFLQGVRVSDTSKYLNIYSLTGGEIRKNSNVMYTEVIENGKVIKKYYENDANPNTDDKNSGYVANQKAAAKDGGSITYYDDLTEKDTVKENGAQTVKHVHRGSSTAHTGCYITPVYHVHSDTCYTNYRTHVHDENGPWNCQKIISYHTHTAYGREETYWQWKDGKWTYTGSGTTQWVWKDAYTLQRGCYTYKFHQHTSACGNGSNCSYWDIVTDKDKITRGWDTFATLTSSGVPDAGSIANAREYIMNQTLESQSLTCGKKTTDQEGYTWSCGMDGKKEAYGQDPVDGNWKPIKGDTNGTYDPGCHQTGKVDHYDLGCGHKSGELVSKAEDARFGDANGNGATAWKDAGN